MNLKVVNNLTSVTSCHVLFALQCVLHGVFSGIILARSQRSRILGMPALLQTADDLSWGNFMVLALLRVILGKLETENLIFF